MPHPIKDLLKKLGQTALKKTIEKHQQESLYTKEELQQIEAIQRQELIYKINFYNFKAGLFFEYSAKIRRFFLISLFLDLLIPFFLANKPEFISGDFLNTLNINLTYVLSAMGIIILYTNYFQTKHRKVVSPQILLSIIILFLILAGIFQIIALQGSPIMKIFVQVGFLFAAILPIVKGLKNAAGYQERPIINNFLSYAAFLAPLIILRLLNLAFQLSAAWSKLILSKSLLFFILVWFLMLEIKPITYRKNVVFW